MQITPLLVQKSSFLKPLRLPNPPELSMQTCDKTGINPWFLRFSIETFREFVMWYQGFQPIAENRVSKSDEFCSKNEELFCLKWWILQPSLDKPAYDVARVPAP